MSPEAHPIGGRRAWLVWTLATLVYVAAMFHRTSLGVAALDAQERFGITAAVLSVFTMLQLGVYLVMQVPTGVMADRFGPRRMLAAAVACMVAGELLFAVAGTVPLAITGRVLVGFGDALTYLNVLRLAATWFPRSRYPLLAALTTMLGNAGLLLSTLPLAAALDGFGWTAAFAGTAALTALVGVGTWLWVRDHPRIGDAPATTPGISPREILDDVRGTFARRGTRTGTWTHYVLMGPFGVFSTLWGIPYMVRGQGMSTAAASAVMAAGVIAAVAAAPVVGGLASRSPHLRRPMALTAAGLQLLSWAAIVAWPGGVLPMPVLVFVVVVIGACGPTAILGFDMARDASPASRSGSASGLVNIGGFTFAVVGALAVGLVLDLLGPAHGPQSYQLAFLPVAVMVALGCVRMTWLLLTRAPARQDAQPAEQLSHQ